MAEEVQNTLTNKKILVTGGAGFIGTELCRELLKQGNIVLSLDNYSSGSKDKHIPGVQYIEGSTKDITSLLQNKNFTPDIIYHLGEYSRVEQSFDDIEKVIAYNKIGTLSVLEYTRINKNKLIYAGSSTKFGDNGDNKSASPYAWSKASNTDMVANYGEWFNIDYAITYFYNVYGPGELKTGNYATLIGIYEHNYKTSALKVVQPGVQRRNFTHIYDTVSALVLVGAYGHGEGYGIGAEESYSVLDVAKMFKTNIEFLPERKGNRLSAPVLSDKIKAFGWKQQYTLENYIKNLIN